MAAVRSRDSMGDRLEFRIFLEYLEEKVVACVAYSYLFGFRLEDLSTFVQIFWFSRSHAVFLVVWLDP